MEKFNCRIDFIETLNLSNALYDCSHSSTPLIFENGNLEKALKKGPVRYNVPLYPLSSKLFFKLGEVIEKIQNEKLSEENWILIITPDRMGLHCYSTSGH